MPSTLPLDGDDWTLYWLLPDEWKQLRVWESEPPEAASRRIPARVPGHAQEALLAAGTLPDPRVGANSGEWQWTSERDWIYEKTFTIPQELEDSVLRLRFEGIDDTAHVYLNGQHVGSHRGQFVPAEWKVNGIARLGEQNQLLVIVEHAPAEIERRWKARFPYQAELCPRIVPVGLWDSVSLIATGPAWFETVAVHTNIANDQTECALSIVSDFHALETTPAYIQVEVTQSELPVGEVEDAIILRAGDTAVLVQSLVIKHVQLWWPNGQGRQPLYCARLTLYNEADEVLDQRTVEFGVRQVELLPNEGAPPDALPYTLAVNGRKIWIQGWNWVPVDLFYGGVTEERYDRLLRLAKDAYVNVLRVWGGGLLEKEAFYRLCDRYGIMVWQEFPLTGTPPTDEAYLPYIRDQAEAMLARRRNHPSLVLWSGGDSLADAEGKPLTNEHPALAELWEAVKTDDPQRLWLATSPNECADTDPPLHRALAVVADSELLQTIRLQYAVESDRRRQWRCFGTLPGQFNEPWPNVAGTSVVAYGGQAKPAYYAVKRAYAPFHVSAEFKTFLWTNEAEFSADVWLHNCGPERSLLNVVCTIVDLAGRELYAENLAAEALADGSECVGDLAWRFPAGFEEVFVLLLEVIDEEGDTIARNHYYHSRAAEAPLAALLRDDHGREAAERWKTDQDGRP